jgi:glutamyl-tRNA reductase
MSIVVIGVNHRTGPLSVLERVTIQSDDVAKAVAGLSRRDNIREVAVLSTCNRTEIYAVAERFHGAYADICSYLCELGDLDPNDLNPYLYSQHDDAAVAHLFAVAAGLESAVLGESEILGQVREAWKLAQAEGGARATLNQLFRQALRVGKRARTETAIGRGTTSVSHAAVEMLSDRVDSLAEQRVLVVGAGAMGEGVAVALAAHGAGEVTVVNRHEARAQALATRVAGKALPFDRLHDAVAGADVIVTCTGSGSPLITVDTVSPRRLADRPLHIIDIAVPRDVDAAVAELPGVSVLDLDDLRDWADRGLAARSSEAEGVRAIVLDEVEAFNIDRRSREASPLVASMRRRADDVRADELERYAARLASLDESQREAVEALTKSLVAKLLHEPSVRLKHDAGTPRGERNAAAVRDLFDLG